MSLRVEVFAVRVDVARSEALMEFLPDEERTRARAFRREHDVARFVAAHAALRRLVAARVGGVPRALAFATGPNGKPGLAAGGALGFNLSHSGDFALVALAEGADVGVDVETCRAPTTVRAIAERYFSFADAERIALLPSEAAARVFCQLWCRFEALAKAQAQGMAQWERLPEGAFPGGPLAPGAVGDPVAVGAWCVRDLGIDAGHCAAVAARGAFEATLSAWDD